MSKEPNVFSPKFIIGAMIGFGFIGFVAGAIVATIGMIWGHQLTVLIGQTVMAIGGVPFASAAAFSALFMSDIATGSGDDA